MVLGVPVRMVATTLAAFLFLAGLAAPPGHAADPKKITVAYCADCVQFHFQNKNGDADGLIIDLWRLWSEKTDIAVEFQAADWEETPSKSPCLRRPGQSAPIR